MGYKYLLGLWKYNELRQENLTHKEFLISGLAISIDNQYLASFTEENPDTTSWEIVQSFFSNPLSLTYLNNETRLISLTWFDQFRN